MGSNKLCIGTFVDGEVSFGIKVHMKYAKELSNLFLICIFYLLNCDMLSFGAVYFAAQGVFNCEVCRERSRCLHPNFGPHS